MSAPREHFLNHVFLKNRISELGIKQWWLAEQLGVDRRTVIRWVNGQVRSLQMENAEALCRILECGLDQLTLQDQSEAFATTEDQKAAAKLLVSSQLVDKLGPIGEWNLVESLLKASLVPSLPLNILGELYDQLCVASWRQSKLDQAARYNEKTLEIARKVGDQALLASAIANRANLLSWRGKIRQAIDTYSDCLKLSKFTDPRAVASVLSNLGAVQYESGELEAGERQLRHALAIYEEWGRPTNLSIAHCHLAILHLKSGRVAEAKAECERSLGHAERDEYRRGLAMGKLILAEVAAREKSVAKARTLMKEGAEAFAKLGINESLNYEFTGRTYRLLGDLSTAQRELEHGIGLAAEFPLSRGALFEEMAYLLRDRHEQGARTWIDKAIALYADCEASAQVERLTKSWKP